MERLLENIGVPPEYPAEFHVQLREFAHAYFEENNTQDDIKFEFISALKSVFYRFITCFESGGQFSESIENYGDAPAQPERYYQERDFFSFIACGITCIESLSYALFALGAAHVPDIFRFTSQADRRGVSPRATLDTYRQIHATQLVEALEELVHSSQYEQWRTWRNILSHRGLPGRIIYGSTNPESQTQGRYKDFGEVQGPEIHPDTISTMQNWLSLMISRILQAAVEFFSSAPPYPHPPSATSQNSQN